MREAKDSIIREYTEGLPVRIYIAIHDRYVVEAISESGYNTVQLDLLDIIYFHNNNNLISNKIWSSLYTIKLYNKFILCRGAILWMIS